MHVRKVSEVSGLVGSGHDTIGGSCGGSDDQVMGASRPSRPSNVRQQRRVLPGDSIVVVMYRYFVENIVEKRTLCGATSWVSVQLDTGEVFGDHDRGDGDVVVLRQRIEIKLPSSTGNDRAGVE